MTALRPSFNSVTFRRALGHVPTAVSVVTATDEQGHVGMTVGSFTSSRSSRPWSASSRTPSPRPCNASGTPARSASTC